MHADRHVTQGPTHNLPRPILPLARPTRLPNPCLQALDAAIRRHDPHALDALLMQFAAVIVSTTGAEVDRMEREIMVSGVKASAISSGVQVFRGLIGNAVHTIHSRCFNCR